MLLVPEEPFNLSVSEAAAIIGVHPSTIRDYVERGLLPCRRTPKQHRRFRRSDVEALLSPEPGTAA
jgi:excisionase family DNA binding protein